MHYIYQTAEMLEDENAAEATWRSEMLQDIGEAVRSPSI